MSAKANKSKAKREETPREEAPREEAPRDETPIAEGTSAATKISASVGIIAAVVLGVLVNILVARHYRRWDVTRGGLYTLSDATTETLRALQEPVEIDVLLSEGDPLTLAVGHLLESYRGETTRLNVSFTDPDRRPAEFLAVQQRFGIAAGKTEDGKIVADTAIVVAKNNVPHFITLRDLVEVDDEDELRRRPRLEQALTRAIRAVVSNDRPRLCFATGHGEGSAPPGAGPSAGGLDAFRESLIKNNFDLKNVGPASSEDASALDGCRVLVIAGPGEKVPAEDVARYRAFADKGGSFLVTVGPAFDGDRERYLRRGLDDLFGLFGLKLNEDFVFELDPKQRLAAGFGEAFAPIPKAHPITEGLLKAADRGLSVYLTLGSSIEPTRAGAAAVSPLLETSDQAFGMADFVTWSKTRPPPSPGPADHKGPLAVAMASELPKRAGSTEPHGARMVLIGSASALYGANWQNDELRGTSIFVGSAVAWLAARPVLLDIPTKPTFNAGLKVSDAWLGSTFRYVVIYIPLASVMLGLAVYLRRRSSEKRGPREETRPPAKRRSKPRR
ncbi:MAG: GldG family protein [Byssovorax sp.]